MWKWLPRVAPHGELLIFFGIFFYGHSWALTFLLIGALFQGLQIRLLWDALAESKKPINIEMNIHGELGSHAVIQNEGLHKINISGGIYGQNH